MKKKKAHSTNMYISYRYGNSLRPYQLEGLNWLRFCYFNYRSSILADEMGLGKTVQSVAFLNDIYYNLGVRGPFLIIAPLSSKFRYMIHFKLLFSFSLFF
jgi:SNF2 family DNA or RNA helicase